MNINWNNICEIDNFTVPSRFFVKATKIFLSSDIKNNTKAYNPSSSFVYHVCWPWIHVMALPKKVLKSFILYCKNFGRFYFRTLFCLKLNSSEIFLQVMYLRAGHLLAVGGVVGGGGGSHFAFTTSCKSGKLCCQFRLGLFFLAHTDYPSGKF